MTGSDQRRRPATSRRLERNFELGGAGDGCQSPPSTGALGFEHPDFFILRAPKPSIILAAEKDYKDIVFTRKTFQEARQAYQLLGVSEQMDMFAYNDGHAFSQPRRQAATGWMRRWLWNDPRPVAEPELQLQSRKTLNVTSEGSVLQEFEDARSLVDLNLAAGASSCRLLANPSGRHRRWSDCLNEIRNLLCICDSLGTLHLESQRRHPSRKLLHRESSLFSARTNRRFLRCCGYRTIERPGAQPSFTRTAAGKLLMREPGGPNRATGRRGVHRHEHRHPGLRGDGGCGRQIALLDWRSPHRHVVATHRTTAVGAAGRGRVSGPTLTGRT